VGELIMKINRATIATSLGTCISWVEKEPMAVIAIDGGFASQLLRYAMGNELKKRGYHVAYDITWYDECGKSVDGKNDRIFRLTECFDKLEFPVVEASEVSRYKKFYNCELNGKAKKIFDNKRVKEPFYVPGKTILTELFLDYRDLFDFSKFPYLMNEKSKTLYKEIQDRKSHKERVIGVHVRRGDMSKTGHYWNVLTGEYYITVIKKIATANDVFYFFSEDLDWVVDNIVKNIDITYRMVDTKDKEYIDFFLFSLCDILIEGQSSWSERAMFFNNDGNKKLYVSEKHYRDESFYNNRYGIGSTEIIKLEDNMYVH